VRVAVKDLFAVRGHRVGAGSPAYLADAPIEQDDAPAVAALLRAGADVVGIAQTDELAYSLAGMNPHYGTPPNPAAPGCTTGGSTSGPAAAVAAGLADLGLGTDTAGSIRVPASYCGLYGVRPTHGAVSTAGVVPLAQSFDTVGILTRDANLLDAVAGVLIPESAATVARLVVADDVLASVPSDMALAVADCVEPLAAKAGLPLRRETSVFAGRADQWLDAFLTVQAAEAWANNSAFVQRHPYALDPAVAARLRRAQEVTPRQEAAARTVLADATDQLAGTLAPDDALILPATSSTALPLDAAPADVDAARGATLRLTCLASLTGRPAVVIPLLRVDGRPAGVCLLGARGSDRALVKLATTICPG
jgi:Asp-tRNA(Asn)/Glu-tRNA(Gln) amidotransferase A subunit family amidase